MTQVLASHNAADSQEMRERITALLPVGREQAISASKLADETGFSKRMIGAHIANLIEIDGYLIGSLCGPEPGYFFIRDAADLEAGVGHIVRRAAASFRRVEALKKAATFVLGPNQLALFEKAGL